MPASQSKLEILVDVKNAQSGARDLRDVGKAGREAGQSAEGTGHGLQGMAKNLAVAAGGAAVVKKGFDLLKGSADNAIGLAKSTAGLARTTGLDTESASAWVSMAKQRGIETDTLQKGFLSYSKSLVGVEKGNKGAIAAFKDLGIQAKDLKGLNMQESMLVVADAFEKLPAGADKSVLAQKLFGRASRDLLPLLNMGSEGLQEQMDIMKKHGLTMDESGVKKGLALAKTQRELQQTSEGLKMSIGQALLPVMLTFAETFAPILQGIAGALQSSPLLTTAVIALTVALGALIVAMKIAAIVTAVTGATIALLPIIIAAAVVALLVGLVIAYKKIGWFRDAVDAAFGFIKMIVGTLVSFFADNWKRIAFILLALTGPVGLIIALFIKFRGQIFDVVGKVIGKLGEIVSFVTGMVGKLAAPFSGLFKPLLKAAEEVVKAVLKVFTGLVDKLTGIVDKITGLFDKTVGKVGGFLGKIGGAVLDVATFQHGGVMAAGGGIALVGEAGPELLQLPGGARVTPLQSGTVEPVDVSGLRFGGEIHVHLEANGRELAHVVARDTAEQAAAR